MQLLTGEVDRIIERQASYQGETWTEHTVALVERGYREDGSELVLGRTYVVATKALVEDGLPAEGDRVVLEVVAKPYASKKNVGEAGVEWKGIKRRADLEAVVFASSSPGLRSAV